MKGVIRGQVAAWGSVAALVVLFSGEAFSMGKMVLFSDVSGVVLDGGQPVGGAVLERRFFWHWKDEKGQDQATTDAQGRFSFPALVRSSFLGGLLPHEPVIEQSIVIRHGGKEYQAWVFAKGEYDANGELGGRPIRLRCDLQSPARRANGIYGICELQ